MKNVNHFKHKDYQVLACHMAAQLPVDAVEARLVMALVDDIVSLFDVDGGSNQADKATKPSAHLVHRLTPVS